MELVKEQEPYRLELRQDQVEMLAELNIYPGDLRHISGKRIHDFVFLPDAFTDDEHLIFIEGHRWHGSWKDAQNFIYYIGAEHEAELRGCLRGILVFKNIDEIRFRYADDEEVAYDDIGEEGTNA